jgi:putrescine aminotransferase
VVLGVSPGERAGRGRGEGVNGEITSREEVAGIYARHLSSGKLRIGEMLGGHLEVSSRGSLVIDAADRQMLDCGGYGVFLLGHCHERVVAAVTAQAARLPLATRALLEPMQAFAAQALARLAPEGLQRVYFGTSGADVVEAALKLARLNGKRRLLGVDGAFHGKTFGALSVSGNRVVRDPFAPLLPETEILPFGDADALRLALAAAPGECCVLLEPIQGEGGVRTPPAGYLLEVAAACAEHRAMLIFDEIATGLGRTGIWWECMREGVTPDVILAGKVLSGGVVPVAAVVASDEAFAPFDRDPYIHSATFAGAGIAMAAASATLEVLECDDVPGRASELGARLRDGLAQAMGRALGSGLVREIRGQGLLIGVEFDAPQSAGEFELELLARRVIPNHSLNHHAVVRFTPCAYMSDGEVEWLLKATREASSAILAQRRRRFATKVRR